MLENRPRFEATPEQHERLLNSFIEVVELGEIDAIVSPRATALNKGPHQSSLGLVDVHQQAANKFLLSQ